MLDPFNSARSDIPFNLGLLARRIPILGVCKQTLAYLGPGARRSPASSWSVYFLIAGAVEYL